MEDNYAAERLTRKQITVVSRPYHSKPPPAASPHYRKLRIAKQPTSIAIGWSEPVCGREFTRQSPAAFPAHCFNSEQSAHAPWETICMKKRELQIIRHGWGLVGLCSACRHPFVPSPELRRQSEAQERQLRDDFEKHTCDEDSSKPAEAGESSS